MAGLFMAVRQFERLYQRNARGQHGGELALKIGDIAALTLRPGGSDVLADARRAPRPAAKFLRAESAHAGARLFP